MINQHYQHHGPRLWHCTAKGGPYLLNKMKHYALVCSGNLNSNIMILIKYYKQVHCSLGVEVEFNIL